MMKLQPNETVLVGSWLIQDGQTRRDIACERIEWLMSHHLQKISDSQQWGAWETLYRDPDDGRFWERTYPKGEMHGGGPPQLQTISDETAKRKYGI